MATSRGRLADMVEYIANQIALCSHYRELWQFYKGVDNEKSLMYEMEYDEVKEERRKAMRFIQSQFESFDEESQKHWCIVKHAIASYQFISEVQDATEKIDSEVVSNAYIRMIQSISLFIGEEPQVCWRCLEDQVLSHKGQDGLLNLQPKENLLYGSRDKKAGI